MSNLKGQKLVTEGNQWNIGLPPTFSPDYKTRLIRIGEEALIDEVAYHKVYSSSDTLESSWTFNERYIRQDSSNKVYYKQNNNDEFILYDFGLAVNDTFTYSSLKTGDDYVCQFFVSDIDTVLLATGELRKRLKLDNVNPDMVVTQYWVEGIGTNFGMDSHYGLCFTDYSAELLCFYSEGELIYPESPAFCFLTNVEELNSSKGIEVYPNPTFDMITILDMDSNLNSYYIFDLFGRQVATNQIQERRTLVELRDLSCGYFTLLLKDKNGNHFSQKLIKI